MTLLKTAYLDLLRAVAPAYFLFLQAAGELGSALQAGGGHPSLLLQPGLFTLGCCQGGFQAGHLVLHTLQGRLLLPQLGIGGDQQRLRTSQCHSLWLYHLQQQTEVSHAANWVLVIHAQVVLHGAIV